MSHLSKDITLIIDDIQGGTCHIYHKEKVAHLPGDGRLEGR
jgi:hypothetical protein